MNRREALAALLALPATATLSQAQVGPSDVIVLECDDHLSEEARANISQTLLMVWPGRKIVVLGNGMKIKIARETV